MPDILAQVTALGIVPVVEIDDASRAVPLAETLTEAGLPVLEVTFRTAAAADAVARIAAALPGFLLGAGTLLTAETVGAAAAAGARFGVSPGIDRAALAAAAQHGLPFVPGAVTPTEIMTCLDAGARHIKFFPAGRFGGLSTLAALAAPFAPNGIRFMPTGGVTADTAASYLATPSVFAVGGTWIAPRGDIAAGRFDAIADRARHAAGIRAAVEEAGRE
jgi:2-dehydro-3-deoxyphosphogluconate aldolase/(4S)-4-hydroxy-2-oxoglutarate aldolase